MAAQQQESGSRHHTYCRKQKSLGLLCSNFLSLYDRDGVETVGLDDAATRLGVERRRIYDIVNVLESIGVLARKAKNRYTWRGLAAIPRALDQLKQEGLRDNCGGTSYLKVLEDEEDEQYTDPYASIAALKYSRSSKADNRKEKSLGLLTQNFIKLFLCSNMDIISLDEAAKILLGDARDPSTTRTKVRRLYDIANVLSSMKFIEKTHHPETRKSGFRWLGISGRSQSGPANSLATDETKKRTFGTDLTNTSFKRSKLASPYDAVPYQVVKPQSQMQVKCEIFEDGVDRSNLEQKVKNHQFGPFAPLNVPKVGAAENNKVKQVHDWESLASTYRPQYHNQALKDLFGHYMEAWKSWYSEVAGKNPVQLIS